MIDKKAARKDVYVRRNLRREARLLQQIHHQNVVQLMEVLETENRSGQHIWVNIRAVSRGGGVRSSPLGPDGGSTLNQDWPRLVCWS